MFSKYRKFILTHRAFRARKRILDPKRPSLFLTTPVDRGLLSVFLRGVYIFLAVRHEGKPIVFVSLWTLATLIKIYSPVDLSSIISHLRHSSRAHFYSPLTLEVVFYGRISENISPILSSFNNAGHRRVNRATPILITNFMDFLNTSYTQSLFFLYYVTRYTYTLVCMYTSRSIFVVR